MTPSPEKMTGLTEEERAQEVLPQCIMLARNKSADAAIAHLAAAFTSIRHDTIEEMARVADAIEGHYAVKTATENHGKWTIGSGAARQIAGEIREKLR